MVHSRRLDDTATDYSSTKKIGQGVWVHVLIESKFGQMINSEYLAKYNGVQCFTDHKFITYFTYGAKVSVDGSGSCLPFETLDARPEIYSDMLGCCD